MLISQTAESALRAVVCLASHPESSLTTPKIAEITQVPSNYLSKVLQELGRARIVRSRRGLHGGFTLESSPDELTLLDVIEAVSPIKSIDKCPLDLEKHGKGLCPLHKRLNYSIEMVKDVFGETTVRELLEEDPNNLPLCDNPAAD